jgi:ketosteroid isomerase-like protein
VSVQGAAADAQSFIDALGRLEADGDPEQLVALFAQEWTREGSARNGSPVRFEGVSILELHDGHITRFKAYFDPHQVGRQTG